MQIDWLSFTPIPSLLGGALLGIAAALYVLLHGRILGISGIVAGLLHPNRNDVAWRLSIILGIITAPWILRQDGLLRKFFQSFGRKYQMLCYFLLEEILIFDSYPTLSYFLSKQSMLNRSRSVREHNGKCFLVD